MIHALVTAATGMLGRHLVDVLLDEGAPVRAYQIKGLAQTLRESNEV